MMCQHGSPIITNGPRWPGVLMTGKLCVCGGRGYMEMLCSFCSALLNLKLLFKKASIYRWIDTIRPEDQFWDLESVYCWTKQIILYTHTYMLFKKKVFGCKDKWLSGWPVQLWKKMHQWHPPPMEGRTLPHN